ncbi:hypothetical protein MFLAVUS_005672 [Mucor flavus]|uniref:Uncharacterized protein n=1 Tax=Mucor flavus TaxID=439312 RepID=A0ABP9YZF1_9FUNG
MSAERKKFYQLGVNAARIINIHYPDQKIMTVPVHNDYYQERLGTLASIKPILGYDPTKSSTLRDPKFTSLTEEERHKQAVVVHQTRLARIIQNIRSPGLQYSVAKYFYQQLQQRQLALEALCIDCVMKVIPYLKIQLLASNDGTSII